MEDDADADAEVGRGQTIVADRIGLEVHQEHMAGTRGCTYQTDMSNTLT